MDLLYSAMQGVSISVASFTGEWVGGGKGWWCRISSYTGVMWTGMLFVLLAVISLDKLIAVVYPLKYTLIVNSRMVWVMASVTVCTPIIVIVMPLAVMESQKFLSYDFFPQYAQCTLFFEPKDGEFYETPILFLPYVLWTLMQVIPLFIIIICYYKIFGAVRTQVQNNRRQSVCQQKATLRPYKAVITIFLIVITFVITWIPEYLMDVLIVVGVVPENESPSMFAANVITRWLYFLSPTLDPFIYALRHQRLQSAIKQTFFLPRYRGPFKNSESDGVLRRLRRVSTAIGQGSSQLKRRSMIMSKSMTDSMLSVYNLRSSPYLNRDDSSNEHLDLDNLHRVIAKLSPKRLSHRDSKISNGSNRRLRSFMRKISDVYEQSSRQSDEESVEKSSTAAVRGLVSLRDSAAYEKYNTEEMERIKSESEFKADFELKEDSFCEDVIKERKD